MGQPRYTKFMTLPELGLAFGVNIALVCRDRRRIALEQFVPDPAVVNLRCRGLDAVNHATFDIHADVCLHTEIPVVAFPRR